MKKLFFFSILLGVSLSVSAQFAGGTGTADDPYQITTAEQLQSVNDFSTANFKLMNDIDLSDVPWNPISGFTGNFDGNGMKISNLSIEDGSDSSGLFRSLNTPGVIENLTMTDCYLVTGNWSGIMVGTNGNWEKLGGTIRNCNIYDSGIEGGDLIGAFSGVSGGNYENCRAFNVTVEGSGANTGGITADNEGGGYYHDCVFYGTVVGNANTGGICSFYNGASKSDETFKNCVVYGNISSSTSTVGGLLGLPNWNTSNASIINCVVFADCQGYGVGAFGGNALRGKLVDSYATGNIKVLGMYTHDGWDDPWNAGLCAVNFNGPIQDCYYSGTIEASADGVKIAGICGRNWPGITVKNCYYNSDGAPMGMGDGDDPATYDTHGLLYEDMQNLSNFNFSDMSKWQIAEGTTPFLANQTSPLAITTCNTATIEGTGSSNLEYVYVIGSITGSIRGEVAIDNGNWTLTIADGDVVEGETVTVLGFDKNKMPSMITKAKVSKADPSGINNVNKTENANVVGVYNVSGQRLNSENCSGVKIYKYSDGRTVKSMK